MVGFSHLLLSILCSFLDMICYELGLVLTKTAGSDVANIKTTAERNGDHYIVNGAKKWITNAIWADYVTAAVRTSGPGAAGVSVLIIPLSAPGVTRRAMHNSGVAASGSTYITFDDVKVPVSNLIYKEGRGFEVIMSNFNPERRAIAIASIRLSRVCVEDAWNHACTRETFGRKLIENPVIRAKFVRMGRMIEPAQALLEQVLWLVENERKNGPQEAVKLGGMTALLKIVSTRCLEKCVREAQQVMGGLGYARGGKGGRFVVTFLLPVFLFDNFLTLPQHRSYLSRRPRHGSRCVFAPLFPPPSLLTNPRWRQRRNHERARHPRRSQGSGEVPQSIQQTMNADAKVNAICISYPESFPEIDNRILHYNSVFCVLFS